VRNEGKLAMRPLSLSRGARFHDHMDVRSRGKEEAWPPPCWDNGSAAYHGDYADGKHTWVEVRPQAKYLASVATTLTIIL
jgi:hypothetical protein